jgi:cell wall-associated NlpC family hydrolase
MRKKLFIMVLLLVMVVSIKTWASEVRELTEEEGKAAVKTAMEYATVLYSDGQVGVPYYWGGRITVENFLQAVSEGKTEGVGVDASGLVVSVYPQVVKGLCFRIPQGTRFIWVADTNSSMLYEWNVRPLTVDELRAGDLIFFSSESSKIGGVGIFVERVGRQIYYLVASANHNRVIHTFSNMDGTYWKDRFAGAGRLLVGTGE